MAIYAQRRDSAGGLVGVHRQVGAMRTARPRRGGAKTLTWGVEGAITLARDFRWVLIGMDPVSEGDLPEHKRIVAVWARSGGFVSLIWRFDDGVESGLLNAAVHNVNGNGFDKQTLPQPYILHPDRDGVWIRPELDAAPPFPVEGISFAITVETVPI